MCSCETRPPSQLASAFGRGVADASALRSRAGATPWKRSVALTQIRVTQKSTEICSNFFGRPVMRKVGESLSRRALTTLRPRRRRCAAWRWRRFGSRKRAPKYVFIVGDALWRVRSGSHNSGARLQHCGRDAADAQLGAGANSVRENVRRHMFHWLVVHCGAYGRVVIIHARTYIIAVGTQQMHSLALAQVRVTGADAKICSTLGGGAVRCLRLGSYFPGARLQHCGCVREGCTLQARLLQRGARADVRHVLTRTFADLVQAARATAPHVQV